jgi:hypothetical protein
MSIAGGAETVARTAILPQTGEDVMGSLSTAIATGSNGFVPDESGLVKEELVVTGASSNAGDTGTWTSYMKQPQFVSGGPFTYSISGQTVTLTDKAGIGSGTAGTVVFGYP